MTTLLELGDRPLWTIVRFLDLESLASFDRVHTVLRKFAQMRWMALDQDVPNGRSAVHSPKARVLRYSRCSSFALEMQTTAATHFGPNPDDGRAPFPRLVGIPASRLEQYEFFIRIAGHYLLNDVVWEGFIPASCCAPVLNEPLAFSVNFDAENDRPSNMDRLVVNQIMSKWPEMKQYTDRLEHSYFGVVFNTAFKGPSRSYCRKALSDNMVVTLVAIPRSGWRAPQLVVSTKGDWYLPAIDFSYAVALEERPAAPYPLDASHWVHTYCEPMPDGFILFFSYGHPLDLSEMEQEGLFDDDGDEDDYGNMEIIESE